MDVRPSRQLRFPPFRLDPDNACLWRGTKAVRLTPKAFAVLQCLAERHGQLVTKDVLLESVWPATAVGDAVLKVCVREIRKALGDRVGAPRFVATVHRRGYRFIAGVTDSDPRPERDGASERSPVGSGPTSGSRYRGPAHLVGRESALDRLQRGIEAAWRGTRQIVFVTGEPGIGKTGVVEAFLERVTVDPRVWIAHARTELARGRRVKADAYWTRSAAVLDRLAASLKDDADLHRSFLAQPAVQTIRRHGRPAARPLAVARRAPR